MSSHFNIFGYLVAFSPIAVGHLCIPPLSYFEYFRKENDERITKIFELIYSLVPAFFLEKDFVLSLLLVKSKDFSIKSSSITHLFVHATYEHLIGNLSSAFVFGGPVCDEFGAMGLYALFLGGGLFSSLTTFLHADQLNALNELLLIEEKKSQNYNIPGVFISPFCALFSMCHY
jgi:membrane associated rhomboid family serine protease